MNELIESDEENNAADKESIAGSDDDLRNTGDDDSFWESDEERI